MNFVGNYLITRSRRSIFRTDAGWTVKPAIDNTRVFLGTYNSLVQATFAYWIAYELLKLGTLPSLAHINEAIPEQ